MSIALAAVIAPVHAQTPVPIVVPAASGATVSSSQPQVRSAVVVDPNDPAKVLQQLQQMKAANEETIRKQEAMLQHLDELQKTTEQLRILISRS
ncbi:MAG: hypothetical protein ACJ8IQ_09600 [Chthoniobacterales bacterium]